MAVELVSGAEIGRRLGVSREAVRLWRARPGFPEPLGRVGQALVWDWAHVQRWVDEIDLPVTSSRQVKGPRGGANERRPARRSPGAR
jgi:hypothetical protein